MKVTPPVAALLLIALFARLGFWQLDRAGQKVEMQQAFDSPGEYISVSDHLEPGRFQAIEASGRFLPEQQVLIDNVVFNGQIGYYVITPFRYSGAGPLLLVNRGWLAKQPGQTVRPDLSFVSSDTDIRGKAGRLPRVGVRPGEAFATEGDWPRIALWPTIDEVAAELDRDLLPYVLLLDDDMDSGYTRSWQPRVSGPSSHYGYAFQWFAMAIGVIALAYWHLIRGRKKA